MPVRRALLDLILEIAKRDGLDQWGLAHCVGMTRPRASNLLHGHIEKFNSETLIDVLARLGVGVQVTVTERRHYLRWNIAQPRAGWRPPPHFVTHIED